MFNIFLSVINNLPTTHTHHIIELATAYVRVCFPVCQTLLRSLIPSNRLPVLFGFVHTQYHHLLFLGEKNDSFSGFVSIFSFFFSYCIGDTFYNDSR